MTTNAYRNAYETALAELTEITAKFEQLRTHKGHVENLITVLHSIFSSDDSVEATSIAEEMVQVAIPQSHPAPEPKSETPPSYSYLDVPNPLPESDGDPFHRRVKASFRFKGLATQRSY